MMPFDWTPERVETLKRLWGEGVRPSLIVLEFKKDGSEGPTRNAVIGKLFRLGLSKRHPTAKPQPRIVRVV